MEAASARMAARDRFGAMGDPGPSTLQRYIRKCWRLVYLTNTNANTECNVESACDPQNFEPNLALDLEIADLINLKKGNA